MISRFLEEVVAAKRIWDWLRNYRKRRGVDESSSVASRFIELFESHGVHRNQIPRLLKGYGLAVSDVIDDKTLLPNLSETILDAACKRCSVRREWIDGAESQIHPYHDFYKYPEKFTEFLDKLKSSNLVGEFCGVLISPEEKGIGVDALLILQESIGRIGEKEIYRYHLCNNWTFSYWKARAFLTACIAIARKRGVYIRGIEKPKKEIEKLAFGESLLGWNGEGNWALGHKTWDPEDMCDTPSKYLDGFDPEENQFDIKSALEMWLKLDDKGLMDSGCGTTVRQSFEAELAKYT